jgi:ElaB/YqjD/DUF883 family membrane-anchored ribosome-binding protein
MSQDQNPVSGDTSQATPGVPPAAAQAAADAAETQGAETEGTSTEGTGTEGTQAEDATPETGGAYLTEPTAAQQKVAEGLRTVGERVEALAPEDGVAKELADKASAGLKQAGEWVAGQDAGAALTEAKSFVKRKPWAAAGIAVGALFVLNKLTRALTGGSRKH